MLKTSEEFIDFYYKGIKNFDRFHMLAMINSFEASIKSDINNQLKNIIFNEKDLCDGEVIDLIVTKFNLNNKI